MEVSERIWRDTQSSYLRPLKGRLEITSRGKSRPLQQAICDFGIEQSFARANERLKIHYGFELNTSCMRTVTLHHARRAARKLEQGYEQPYRLLPAQGQDWIIAQADGSMICTVEPSSRQSRRPRQWKEMRLAAARGHRQTRSCFAATFGDVDELGQRWGHCARQAGWNLSGRIHVVADGANWIAQQSQKIFEHQHTFLLDFYHLSEYLASAAHVCRPHKPRQWLRTQQKRLKRGRSEKVLAELQPHCEPQSHPEEQAVVRDAYRYLQNRLDQIDYPHALAHDLPVGSGLIESGHRHVLQQRLKAPGTAWLMENAESMAQLRVIRENQHWHHLWN